MRKKFALITLVCCVFSMMLVSPASAKTIDSDANGRLYHDLGVPDGAPLDYELLSPTILDEFEIGTPTYYTGDPVKETAKMVVGQGPDGEDDREIFLLGSAVSGEVTVGYRNLPSDQNIVEGMDAIYFRQRFKYKNEDQFRWVAGLRGDGSDGHGHQLLTEITPAKQLKLGGFTSTLTVPEDEYVTMELFVNFEDLTLRAFIDGVEYTNGAPVSFDNGVDLFPLSLSQTMFFSNASGGEQFELHIADMVLSSMPYGDYEFVDTEGNPTDKLLAPEATVKFRMPQAVLAADPSVVDADSFQINNGAVIESVEWVDDGSSCAVKLSNLTDGQKYQISFNEEGMDPFQMEMETARVLTPLDIRLFDEGGTDITQTGIKPGKVKAELSIANETGNSLPAFVAAVLYQDGYMTDLQYVKTEAIASQSTPVSVETTVPNDGKDYELKLFYISDPLNATAFYQASSFNMEGTEVSGS